MEVNVKVIQIHNFGHLDQLKTENIPVPTPKENEVLVEVHAVGVNPVDWKIVEGLFEVPAKFPRIVGQDFSGTVIDAGQATHGYQKGDLVYGFANGSYAEYVSVKE